MSMPTDEEIIEMLGPDGPITEKVKAIAERVAKEQGELAVERVLKQLLPFVMKVDEVGAYVAKIKRGLSGIVKG